MAQSSDIRLPSWISPGMVFQQGVPVILRGEVESAQTPVTLEVMKDPTDGRKVSKLDTDYGVILSLETVSDDNGGFRFELPAYRSSTDAYTLVFHSLTKSLTIEDCRCGDVWLMFGGRPISSAISETSAPRTPLKKDVMPLLRFYSPKRNVLDQVDALSYEPILNTDDSNWIRIRDTKELAKVSSVAFSYAYHLAEQLHYPVGILDLAEEYAPIYRWLSHQGIDANETIRNYLEERNLYFDEEGWRVNIARLTEKKDAILSGTILKDEDGEAKREESFVFEDEEKIDVPVDPEGALAFEDQKAGKVSGDGEENQEEKPESDEEPKNETEGGENEEDEDVPPLSFPTEELKHFEKQKNNHDLINLSVAIPVIIGKPDQRHDPFCRDGRDGDSRFGSGAPSACRSGRYDVRFL